MSHPSGTKLSKHVRQDKSQKKYPVLRSSGDSKAPLIASSVGRPGWKGPGFMRKAPKRTPPPAPTPSSSSTFQEPYLPLELQQQLLNVIRTTFPICQDSDSLRPLLQDVKSALFERDFERAFGREDWLEAYAVRWSPSRALCYAAVLAGLCADFGDEIWVRWLLGDRASMEGDAPRVICFGGGAAEIVAFGGLLRHLRPNTIGRTAADMGSAAVEDSLSFFESTRRPVLNLHLVDTANWVTVVSSLHTGLTTPPALSKYASASAKAKNSPLLYPGALESRFMQMNVLQGRQEDWKTTIGSEPALLTLLFTLNELYTESISKTTAFLLDLTLAAPKDSLLVVIDSPGSYSEAAVGGDQEGKEKKKYPMHWLLDHVLLETHLERTGDEEATSPSWEKLVSDDSRWYRLQEGLKYPIGLENMRFQLHLFKRL